LAAGTGFLAATAIAATAMMTNNRMVVVISVAVAGALLGFLRHNFTPASIFLGDSGSLFVGFMLSAAAVIWHQKTTTAIAVVVPLLAFTLPIADTTLAVLRRSLRGQPIFLSDREHIHHRLLASGWTPREALLLLYVASGASAFGCVLILEGQVLVTAAILVAFLVVFVLLGYWMAYPEFMELVERLPKTFSRRDPTIGEPVAQPEAGFGRGLLNPVKPAWEAVPQASQEVKDASSD
jgi:UDP-GlcNAc:undecaprenyl-phosphate GlcNAc-1-phosphate transferase